MELTGSLHRIITEDVNRQQVIDLAAGLFDGFTLRTDATGYWKGQPEKSLTFEVITDDTSAVLKLAELIKQVNKQEAVLVEQVKNTARLV